jgi:hypothetical protein
MNSQPEIVEVVESASSLMENPINIWDGTNILSKP